MTAVDALTVHVRQLLNLDEERQRATLASLSTYVNKSRQVAAQTAGVDGRRTDAQNTHVIAKDLLEKDHVDSAIPNTRSSSPQPMKVTVGGATTMASPLLSQTSSDGPWQKVMQELGSDLPKGAATLMQDLLSQAAACNSRSLGHQPSHTPEHAAQPQDEKIAAVRWLMQRLERQQEASVNKLRSVLAYPGCSGETSDGINVALRPPCTFSVPMTTQTPVPESLHCINLASGNDAYATQPGYDFSPKEPPTLLGGTCLDDSSPTFGVRLLPEVDDQDCCSWHSTGHSSTKAVADLQQSGLATAIASSGMAAGPPETLRMHLQSLLNVDCGRVLIVRKINRLGFASPAVLQEHFSWHGVVERVLVAHSRVKSASATGRCASAISSRLRPSGLGFVVMSKVEEAKAILAHGSEQPVNGIIIQVHKFERRKTADEGDGDEDEKGTVLPETCSSEDNRNNVTSSSSSDESN